MNAHIESFNARLREECGSLRDTARITTTGPGWRCVVGVKRQGTVAWWQTGRLALLAGALLMIADWPWTIFAIMPANKVLMATSLDDADAKTRELIVKWNVLHSVRTVLGGVATVAFLIALSSA